MRINSSPLLLFCLAFTACSTMAHRETTDLNSQTFDSISLGMSTGTALALLGQPTTTWKDKENPTLEVLAYSDIRGIAQGAISVNHASETVDSVIVIPKSHSPEHELDYLLKVKFKDSNFAVHPKQRCSRDYLPLDVFYIDTEKGIVITVDRQYKTVQNFGRGSPQKAAKIIEDLKTCRL